MTTVGLGLNPFSPRVPAAFEEAASRLGISTRRIDLPTLQCLVDQDGRASVRDAEGAVEVTHLAPALLYWQEAAATAYAMLQVLGAGCLNSVEASEIADDKSRTAVALAARGVRQVATIVVPQDPVLCRAEAERVGYPMVVKRTHGAQGRWVRSAADPGQLDEVLAVFAAEGRGALVVQPLVAGAQGQSLRLIVVAGRVVACTRRRAAEGELQSNIAAGGTQESHTPTSAEADLAAAAAEALGLQFAGVDLIDGGSGPMVLEVNAAPDFTSMKEHVPLDIAEEVLAVLLQR